MQDWQRELDVLRAFAINRPQFMRQHLSSELVNVAELAANTLQLDAEGAVVSPNTLLSQTASKAIVINEINYHSAEDFDSDDWVELYNVGSERVDLSQWRLLDSQDEEGFVFPENTILEAGAYLVSCRDSERFALLYQSTSAATCLGDWSFGLKGSGERIRLLNAEGQLVDSLEYGDEAPWPLEADGQGVSLELVDVNADNALAES